MARECVDKDIHTVIIRSPTNYVFGIASTTTGKTLILLCNRFRSNISESGYIHSNFLAQNCILPALEHEYLHFVLERIGEVEASEKLDQISMLCTYTFRLLWLNPRTNAVFDAGQDY